MFHILTLVLATGVAKSFAVRPSRPNDICGIDKLRGETLDKLEELWVETSQPEWQYLARRKGGMDTELVEEFKDLSDKLEGFTLSWPSDKVLGSIWVWPILIIENSNVNGQWARFRRVQARPDSLLYSNSWKELAHNILNDDKDEKHTSLVNSLLSLQEMIWDRVENHKDVFKIVKEETEDQICDTEMSAQQLLYNLYTILQMSQLKAYTMINFSWLLLRIYNEGNFTAEKNNLKQTYLERMSQQATLIRKIMAEAEQSFWKCDPTKHEEGITYTQLTKVLQGFLVNEVDLNKKSTCTEDCGYYKLAQQYSCYDETFCGKQPRCMGNIVDCKFENSDMLLCQAPHHSHRRYDWIKYTNGKELGRVKKECDRPINRVDSWWRWLMFHCSYCLCYCDEPENPRSDRFFSLNEVISSKESNKVVTGIRFVKRNSIIHLQIQEGELLPRGGINETTVKWKPVEDFKIGNPGIEEGKHFHRITWKERAIDLDDLRLPAGTVLTGVQFRKVGSHLNLKALASQYNFTSGTLINNGNKSLWISNDNTDGALNKPRTRLNLVRPDDPVRAELPTRPDSKPEQFVEFDSSDMVLDLGQTTIPFIDTQEVAPIPHVPLVGVGIYHKGHHESGGFIAPKVFTFDFTENILDHFPEINEADFK